MMQEKKRSLSGKRMRIWIVFLIILVLAAAFLLYFLPFPDERAQARRAVSGAYEVIAGLGQFVSEDGTTASLSEKEIRKEIREFDEKADRCYAEEFSAREYYKWLNQDYLTRTYKSTVDYIVKSGVADMHTPFLFYSPGRNQMKLRGELTGWNLRITESDGKYQISCDYNKTPLDVTLVREDGIWKVCQIEGIKGEPETVADEGIIRDAEEKSKVGKLSAEEENILKRIRAVNEICAKKYNTFSEALQAAEKIDFEDFNGYQLKSA